MKILELYETESVGTFIGIKLSKNSEQQLEEWCKENNLNFEPFHITLIVDENQKIPYKPIKVSITLDPDTYKFDVFGDVLVLRFKNDLISNKHKKLRDKYNISWEFNSYKPHITLDYNWDAKKSNRMQLPTFPIELSHEYKEGFDK